MCPAVSQGPSISFRTTSRQHRPSWANRFMKDFNDLHYDYDDQITRKGLKSAAHTKVTDTISTNGWAPKDGDTKAEMQREVDRAQTTHRSKSPTRSRKIIISDFLKGHPNPETYELKRQPSFNSAGLCKFEFEKTIGGQLQFKTNHHLRFETHGDRPPNILPIYHSDPSKCLQTHRSAISPEVLARCHPFKSYSVRDVFPGQPVLDKFYNTLEIQTKLKYSKPYEPIPSDRITGRRPSPEPLGNQLIYRGKKSLAESQKAVINFKHFATERKLLFSRQVISQERGCYR